MPVSAPAMPRTASGRDDAGPSRFPWPPLVYFVATLGAIALHLLLPLPWFGSPFADILFAFGVIVAGAGAAFVISAVRAMRKAGTTVLPHKASARLVTGGVFALSRNPIYLGNSLILLGIGLISGIAWFLLAGVLAGSAIQVVAIGPEERHLDARFGKAFRDYKRQVRRWL